MKHINLPRPTGLKIGKTELIEGDTIRFRDYDAVVGHDYITGVIVFENGCFVVKEPNFEHYDWKGNRPGLLYDCLKENRCKKL